MESSTVSPVSPVLITKEGWQFCSGESQSTPPLPSTFTAEKKVRLFHGPHDPHLYYVLLKLLFLFSFLCYPGQSPKFQPNNVKMLVSDLGTSYKIGEQ